MNKESGERYYVPLEVEKEMMREIGRSDAPGGGRVAKMSGKGFEEVAEIKRPIVEIRVRNLNDAEEVLRQYSDALVTYPNYDSELNVYAKETTRSVFVKKTPYGELKKSIYQLWGKENDFGPMAATLSPSEFTDQVENLN